MKIKSCVLIQIRVYKHKNMVSRAGWYSRVVRVEH